MTRLIDADALFDSMNSLDYESTVKAYGAIANAPTIDAVPVVRCKDCKRCHRFADDSNSNMKSWCLKFSLSKRVNDNDFCAWGEREDND